MTPLHPCRYPIVLCVNYEVLGGGIDRVHPPRSLRHRFVYVGSSRGGRRETVALALSVLVLVHVLLSHLSRASLVVHNIRGMLFMVISANQ